MTVDVAHDVSICMCFSLSYVLCLMSYVLCLMSYVLCLMSYVCSTSSSLSALPRRELQALAKEYGIKASASSAQIITEILAQA
jgi:hypothetical protein